MIQLFSIRKLLFEYSNSIRHSKTRRIRIRIVLFGLNYSNNSNNPNIRSNSGIKMIILRTSCCAGWRLDDCDRENCPLLQDPQSLHFSGTIITQYYSKFKLKVLTCHLSSWRLLTFHSWHTCDQISNSSQFTNCTTSPIQHLPDTRTFEVSLITFILLH